MTQERRFGAWKAGLGLAHGLTLVPGWLGTNRWSAASRRYERAFLQRIAHRLVAHVDVTGAEPAGPGTLFIANHISWLDIPIFGTVLDTGFIAKADVRQWPLIGPLARRSGTLFVEREARHRVHHQADMIAQRLRAGNSLLLFAEGTTSDGVDILPFRSSLFEAAQHAARVQPVAIGYHRGDGMRLGDDQLRAISWAGDESLLPNARRVTGMHLAAEVRLTPCFAPDPGSSRKTLAGQCRDAIADAYRTIRSGAISGDELPCPDRPCDRPSSSSTPHDALRA